jgi:superfamily II DNA/RNA helicase
MQDLKTLPNQDPSLFGYAAAANKFVQMRDHLARQGVGIVRQNLAALRNEPQRGILSSIVKGPECDRLWEEVLKASADPTNTTLQDKLARNPKLMKLAEILTEFFERARACNKSSRAIVFSQFRDSVSEILSTLEHSKPLIRPRHFIGQGKGAKGDAVGQLKGMKQAEQQAAMREFRSDVYNVLIATSIGEEGLDIGEVDLIVNFDTLSSPIRMIQRIGRTGRKRDGKVVCLVLEGAEENTMRKSHQSERTLAHALRKPDSFKNAPNFLMFPNPPELKQMDMAVFQNFRVSQVEGHDKAKQAKRRRSSGEKSRGSIRLSEEDEIRRLQTLGQFANLYLELTLHIVSTVRRRLLTARNMMLVNAIKAKNRYVGKKTALLHQIESAYPFPKAIRSRAVRGETASTRTFWPVAQTIRLLPLPQNSAAIDL